MLKEICGQSLSDSIKSSFCYLIAFDGFFTGPVIKIVFFLSDIQGGTYLTYHLLYILPIQGF
jgi:hypothetical protein